MRFVLVTLAYVRAEHSEVEKVDFVVERNGHISRHIERFYQSIGPALRNQLDRPDLADLLGNVAPAGKDRVPPHLLSRPKAQSPKPKAQSPKPRAQSRQDSPYCCRSKIHDSGFSAFSNSGRRSQASFVISVLCARSASKSRRRRAATS